VVNWVSLSTTAAAMVGGIIEAQVSFVDEQVVLKKRNIPPRVQLAPQAAITPDGASFGVRGTF